MQENNITRSKKKMKTIKNYIFTFEWVKGCVKDYIIKWCKENNINFKNDYSF